MKVEQRIRKLNKESGRLTILVVACGTAAALLMVGQLLLLSETVSGVFLEGQALSDVLRLLGLLLLLIVARSAIIWLREVLAQRAASHLKGDLRRQLTEHLLQLGPSYTAVERSGELVNTVVSGVEDLDAYVTQYLPARNLAVIVPLLVFLIILLIDPLSTLVLTFAGPMLILILALIGSRTKATTERRFEEMNWMSAFFLDILQGLPTLKLFGRSEEQTENIEQISRQYGTTTMDILSTAFQSSLVMEWAAVAATAMVALEVSLRLMNGALPFNQALAVLLLTPEFFIPLRQMALQYHAGTAGKTAAGHIFEILDTPAAQQPLAQSANGRAPGPAVQGDIRLRDVSLTYAEGQRRALDGISLTIGQGQTVALVGQTGGGKSSVAHLLLRFVEPDSGSITMGSTPAAAVPADEWRAQIAWVPQHPHLFHGTVAENLRLARPDATDEEMIAAAQAAHAHEFIQALPQGYETAIGEQGTRLSGGQRQRLAIARAFLKDAPVLILDEATANLDAASERAVSDALRELARGRTVLIIAHRLQMVSGADEILVLENGRVVDQGRPQTLMRQNGAYQALQGALAGENA